MTSVARANARHPAPRPRCVLIVRFLRIDAALLIASMPRTSHGAAAVLGRILTRSHSLRSLALRLPGSPLHANLIRHAPDRCAINNPAPKGTHYEKTHASSPHNGAGKLAGHHHGPGDAGHSHRGAGRKTQLRRNGAKAPFFASLHPPRATAKHDGADPHARRGRGRTRPPAWGAAHRRRVLRKANQLDTHRLRNWTPLPNELDASARSAGLRRQYSLPGLGRLRLSHGLRKG